MEKHDILQKVKEIVSPYCKNQAALDSLSEQTRFLEDLEINSARLVDIVIDFEDAFDIEVDDQEADSIRTVGLAVDMIQSKLGE